MNEDQHAKERLREETHPQPCATLEEARSLQLQNDTVLEYALVEEETPWQ